MMCNVYNGFHTNPQSNMHMLYSNIFTSVKITPVFNDLQPFHYKLTSNSSGTASFRDSVPPEYRYDIITWGH